MTESAAVRSHWKEFEPYLRDWAERGKVPQVLLLKGLPGIGKKEVARKLAQWILCERGPMEKRPEEEPSLFGGSGTAEFSIPSNISSVQTDAHSSKALEPCGLCASCRQMDSSRNVNFTLIEREEGSEALKIEHFRELKEKMGFGGFDSQYRIFLIPEVERMTIQAANSVLKLFEEPPRGWFFFLTSADISRIPITILSRSQAIGLSPLLPSIMREELEKRGVKGEEGETLTHLSQGSLTRAEEFLRVDFKEKILQLKAILERDAESANQLYEWLNNHEESAPLILDLIETFLMDLLWITTNTRTPFHRSLHPEFERILTEMRNPPLLLEKLERIQELRKIMHTNVNQKILFQEISFFLLIS
jgi:DNA polymerase III subunit delta'